MQRAEGVLIPCGMKLRRELEGGKGKETLMEEKGVRERKEEMSPSEEGPHLLSGPSMAKTEREPFLCVESTGKVLKRVRVQKRLSVPFEGIFPLAYCTLQRLKRQMRSHYCQGHL